MMFVIAREFMRFSKNITAVVVLPFGHYTKFGGAALHCRFIFLHYVLYVQLKIL